MIKLKCPLCGSENIGGDGYKISYKSKRRRLRCTKCGKKFHNSTKFCINCFRRGHFKVITENRKYCKKCMPIFIDENRKKKIHKQIFCEMTGISHDRYLELKEFMGIK